MFKLVSSVVLLQLASQRVLGGLVCEEIVDEGDCGSIPECYWEEEPACEEIITDSPSMIPSQFPSLQPSLRPSDLPTQTPISNAPTVSPTLEPTGPNQVEITSDSNDDGNSSDEPDSTEDWETVTFTIDGPFNLSVTTEQDIIDTVENLDSLDGLDDEYNVLVNSLTEEEAILTINYDPGLLTSTELSINQIVAEVETEVNNEHSDGSSLTSGDEKTTLLDDVLANDTLVMIIGGLVLIIFVMFCCLIWCCMCHCRKKRNDLQLKGIKKVELQNVASTDFSADAFSTDGVPSTNNTNAMMQTANFQADLLKAVSVSMDNMPTPMVSTPVSPMTSGDELEEEDGDVVNITGGGNHGNIGVRSGNADRKRNQSNAFPDLPQEGNAVNIVAGDTAYAGGDLGESDSGDSSDAENEIYGKNAAENGVVNIGQASKGGPTAGKVNNKGDNNNQNGAFIDAGGVGATRIGNVEVVKTTPGKFGDDYDL